MKILFIAPRFHTNYSEMVKILISKKHQVFFHAKFKGKIEDYSYIKPYIHKQSFFSKFLTFFLNYKFYYFPDLISYSKKLKKIKPDLAILRFSGRLNFYLICILLKLNKIQIIFHDQTRYDRIYLKNKGFKEFIQYLEFQFIKSFFKAKWFSPIYYKKKPHSNNFYLPIPVPIAKKKVKRKSFVRILTIGKFVDRKDFNLLINVLKKINKKYYLTIIGEQSTEQNKILKEKLIKKINIEKLSDKVEVRTNINFINIKKFFLKNDIFILPSFNEPLSVSVLEAIGSGLPSICSDTCGTKFYISENYNGLIFKSQDPQSLKRKIKFLLNRKKINQFSINCYNYSVKNLSNQVFYNYFKNMINSKNE